MCENVRIIMWKRSITHSSRKWEYGVVIDCSYLIQGHKGQCSYMQRSLQPSFEAEGMFATRFKIYAIFHDIYARSLSFNIYNPETFWHKDIYWLEIKRSEKEIPNKIKTGGVTCAQIHRTRDIRPNPD